MNPPQDILTADEAATFLGVKKQSLYVYVSRGLIRTVKRPGGNRRGYVREDLLRLREKATGKLPQTQPLIDSKITLIDEERGPIYRGYVAVDLARRGLAREQIARLLWSGVLDEKPGVFVPIHPRLHGFRVVEEAKTPLQRIEAALFLLSRDLPRFAMPSETKLAEGIVGVVHDILDDLGVAASFAVHRAFAVLADHELNPSAFAARIAASTGAGLVACLQAALAVFSGPRHGGACDRIEALLDEIGKPGRARIVVRGRLERGEEVPGFFSGIYRKQDPRSAVLLELPEAQRAVTARALVDAMRDLGGTGAPGPSIDLALVALGRGLGWKPGVATAAFAAARMAGWIAHVLEQRQSAAIVRPRARFVGDRL